MDNVVFLNPNSCCNALVKLSCWLILAKYRAAKLNVLKSATEDAALDEFETRLFLRNYYINNAQNNKFLNFTQEVYNKTMLLISDYICSPDWSMFYDEGNSSIWQLKTIIQNEVTTTSSVFNLDCLPHTNCYQLFCSMREQIISIIDLWSNAIYVYSNYISASLSYIFNDKIKKIICKYEHCPNNWNFKWLCHDIMSNCGHDRWQHLQTDEGKSQFWFINDTINLNFFEDPVVPFTYTMCSDEELVLTLSHWLFRECISQLEMDTRRLLNYHVDDTLSSEGSLDVKVLHKEQLPSLLNIPLVNLELHMAMSASSDFLVNFSISEGPHFLIPDNTITELQPVVKKFEHSKEGRLGVGESSECYKTQYDAHHMECTNGGENSNFDIIDSILGKRDIVEDTDYNCKLSDIKVELEDLCVGDYKNVPHIKEELSHCETNICDQSSEMDKISLPKMQIKGRNEISKPDKLPDMYPAVQHKKRGRPKKIDDYSHSTPKNGQHKYSPEDVQDCSIWISDNFYEVAGNKPAIDRARMYELYTNYCLLKLCTPVDRALFGKIIRKVFPKLKSRRLIQNQVLKYHYVGLKPKHPELEQALLYSDSSSMNPGEILVTYVPVEE